MKEKELIECPICHDKLKRINNFHIKKHGLTVKEFIELYPDVIRTEIQLTHEHRQNSIIGIEGIDYVKCPICHKKYKEINTEHILCKHQITREQFIELYPNAKLICDNTRLKKASLINMTPEISNNLKFGHTLEGYIKKYGEEEGKIKFDNMQQNMKYARTLDYQIEKYGEEEGMKRWVNIVNSHKLDLDSFIKRYGHTIGLIKYKEYCEFCGYRNTVYYYINKYGNILGIKKWIEKNSKISKGNRIIDLNRLHEYTSYCIDVLRWTRTSLKLYYLDNIHLRSIKYHLDHKVSKAFGFNNDIDARIIGSIYNLEIIDQFSNCSKGANCSMTIEELIAKVDVDIVYLSLTL